MTNDEISALLRRVAVAYTIRDEKKHRFQIIAYNNAADAISGTTTQIKDLLRENKVTTVPGIGKTLTAHLEELLTTGKVEQFETVLKDVPETMFPLLTIPSFGPKKAYKLVTQFKLKDPKTVIADIEKLAKSGEIAKLEGFGEKSQADMLQAIEEYKRGKDKTVRMVYPYAHELAEQIVQYMKNCSEVDQIYPLGSLRRKASTIGDVDLAVSTENQTAVLDHFTNYPYKERVIQRGENESSLLTSGGKRVDLRVIPKKDFGSLLQHFTGSKNHNVHLREIALRNGISISEYGIKPKEGSDADLKHFQSEEKFYEALGMQWIPPEMREDTGEIELALKQHLPTLVELQDIKGDFHIHSSYPIEPSHDLGQSSMEEMIKRAHELGYHYLGFSEHNPSIANHTPEQIQTIMENRSKFIEQLKKIALSKFNIRIISLLETDIQPSGALALPESAFQYIDATIVSIHSSFGMTTEQMTGRVLKGLSHPKAKILAHPTGRLLNERTGYTLDWEKVFAFAKTHYKALEINASWQRLDLPDTLVKQAVEQGVKLVIDTDSHQVDSMDFMQYGIAVARRGWAKKSDILNTLGYNELVEWFKK